MKLSGLLGLWLLLGSCNAALQAPAAAATARAERDAAPATAASLRGDVRAGPAHR